jgi:hypothetical protein
MPDKALLILFKGGVVAMFILKDSELREEVGNAGRNK